MLHLGGEMLGLNVQNISIVQQISCSIAEQYFSCSCLVETYLQLKAAAATKDSNYNIQHLSWMEDTKATDATGQAIKFNTIVG